jgi:hypothetical protein
MPKEIYIGVYTSDNEAVYTLVITKKSEFSPILIVGGQLQTGQVEAGDQKFYYVRGSSNMEESVVTMAPKSGNPDLQVYFLNNLIIPKYQWGNELKNAVYQSNTSLGAD